MGTEKSNLKEPRFERGSLVLGIIFIFYIGKLSM